MKKSKLHIYVMIQSRITRESKESKCKQQKSFK